MENRVPDIYIMGTQKSATTTLYDWLAQHPEIYAHPLAKDYPYFSNDITHSDGPDLFYSFAINAPDYLSVLGGEVNAMYTPTGPQRMHGVMPSARLIAILRNPVDRFFSAYSYAVERLLEDRDLEQAVRDELAGQEYAPEDALQRDYLAHGQYARQMKKVYQFFSPDQVKVVIFEELKHDPIKILRDIFQFVSVSESFMPNMAVKNQTKGGSRFRLITQITHGRPSSMLVRNLGRALIPFSLRTSIRRKLVAYNRINKQKLEFTESARKTLVDYYKNEVDEVEILLNREIIAWRECEEKTFNR